MPSRFFTIVVILVLFGYQARYAAYGKILKHSIPQLQLRKKILGFFLPDVENAEHKRSAALLFPNSGCMKNPCFPTIVLSDVSNQRIRKMNDRGTGTFSGQSDEAENLINHQHCVYETV